MTYHDALSEDLSEAMYEEYPLLVSRQRQMPSSHQTPTGNLLIAQRCDYKTRYNLSGVIPVRMVVAELARELEWRVDRYSHLDLVIYPYQPVIALTLIDPNSFHPVLEFHGVFAMGPPGL